jgi:hypothetical protein
VEQQEASKLADFAALYPQANLSANYEVNTESESHSRAQHLKGLFYGRVSRQAVFQWGAVRTQRSSAASA